MIRLSCLRGLVMGVVTLSSVSFAQARAMVPDAKAVQAAYDAARDPAASSTQSHESDLGIARAQCQPLAGKTATHVCQIDFVRKNAPDGRLYFDVVTVAEEGKAWVLLSGLCRSKPAAR